MALPIVAVVGRPNVGKSTFVNRIAEADEAIVHEMRGVTRDRSYHKADWNGIEFKLIDTGGIEMGTEDQFQGSIRSQAFEATNEADVIVFIVDGKTGINADDEEVARILRKTSKPVLLAVNKLDTPNKLDELWEFYQLGLGDPFPISATHGHGTGDLLDEVVDHLRKVECSFEDDEDDEDEVGEEEAEQRQQHQAGGRRRGDAPGHLGAQPPGVLDQQRRAHQVHPLPGGPLRRRPGAGPPPDPLAQPRGEGLDGEPGAAADHPRVGVHDGRAADRGQEQLGLLPGELGIAGALGRQVAEGLRAAQRGLR